MKQKYFLGPLIAIVLALSVFGTALANAVNAITVTDSIPSSLEYGSVVTASATATSRDAVQYSTSGSCTNSGAQVTITAHSGICYIHYNDPGNISYSAAAEVIKQVTATVGTPQCTVTPYNVTYDATPHTAGGSCVNASGVDISSFLDLSGTTHTTVNLGYNDSWSFHDPGGNYSDTNGQVLDSITYARPYCIIKTYNLPYDGTAHTLTGTCYDSNPGTPTGPVSGGPKSVGLNGSPLDGNFFWPDSHTNAGDYTNEQWVFSPSDPNFITTGGTVEDIITPATPLCTITPYSVSYTGGPFTASGSCKNLSNQVMTGLNLTGTTHYNAGNYTDSWSFTSPDSNYSNASDSINDVIAPGDVNCNITGWTGNYDGNPHGASGSCAPASTPTRPIACAAQTACPGVINLDLGATFTDAPGGTAHWTFSEANYQSKSGDVQITIKPIDANCTISGYSGNYDGNSHGASGSCTGLGGATLSGLDLGSKFTDAPGGSANWSLTNTDYNSQNGSVNIVINPITANCTVTGYTGNYDGNAHGASGSCTGLGGAPVRPVNNICGPQAHCGGIVSGLDLGATFTDAPGGIANWSLNNPDYNPQSGSVNIVIKPIDANCTISGYSGNYDGNPHGASGSCTGLGGATLSGLDLGSKFTDAPGGSATWSLTNTDYNPQSGSVNIVIKPIDANCTISGYSGNYDGNPHGASGSCTGLGGATLSGLSLGSTFTNVPGGNANWSFSNVDYNSQSSSVSISLSRANPNCSVTPYNVPQNGNPHTAAGSCTGVKGETLSGLDLSGTTHTAAGDYPGDAWKYTDATGNYNNANSTVHDVITATYTLKGFNAPVSMINKVWNSVEEKVNIQLKFQILLGTTPQSNASLVKNLVVTSLSCPKPMTLNSVKASPKSATLLTFDPKSKTFTYNWITPSKNGCYQVTLNLTNGAHLDAFFSVK